MRVFHQQPQRLRQPQKHHHQKYQIRRRLPRLPRRHHQRTLKHRNQTTHLNHHQLLKLCLSPTARL